MYTVNTRTPTATMGLNPMYVKFSLIHTGMTPHHFVVAS
jgi:hypothetical protein